MRWPNVIRHWLPRFLTVLALGNLLFRQSLTRLRDAMLSRLQKTHPPFVGFSKRRRQFTSPVTAIPAGRFSATSCQIVPSSLSRTP